MLELKLPNYALRIVAILATTSAMSAQSAIVNHDKSETNLDAIAVLDLDQRSIIANLATGTEEGLLKAKHIYSAGLNSDNTGETTAALTIQSLSTTAGEDLLSSSTYQIFSDYYGKPDYADAWVQASFQGEATTRLGYGNVDFTSLGLEGRTGKTTYYPFLFCYHIQSTCVFI